MQQIPQFNPVQPNHRIDQARINENDRRSANLKTVDQYINAPQSQIPSASTSYGSPTVNIADNGSDIRPSTMYLNTRDPRLSSGSMYSTNTADRLPTTLMGGHTVSATPDGWDTLNGGGAFNQSTAYDFAKQYLSQLNESEMIDLLNKIANGEIRARSVNGVAGNRNADSTVGGRLESMENSLGIDSGAGKSYGGLTSLFERNR